MSFIDFIMPSRLEAVQRANAAQQNRLQNEVEMTVNQAASRGAINPVAAAQAANFAAQRARTDFANAAAGREAEAAVADQGRGAALAGNILGQGAQIAGMLIPGAGIGGDAAKGVAGLASKQGGLTEAPGQDQATLMSMGLPTNAAPGASDAQGAVSALGLDQGLGVGRPSFMAQQPGLSLGEATMATAQQAGPVQGSGFEGPNAPQMPNIVGGQPRTAVQPSAPPANPDAQPIVRVPPSQTQSQPNQGGMSMPAQEGIPPALARFDLSPPVMSQPPHMQPAAGGMALLNLLQALAGAQ